MSGDEKIIRVGSRKSELALIQTKHVIARLQKIFSHRKFEIHTMSTIGDRVLNISLPKIGEKSLFTRDLEDALRNGGVDFVVHSLKDLPTALPAGMAIGAVLEREDARDALVLNEKFKGNTIKSLPKGSIIGTSSLRRTAQIRREYPHLVVCDIRGNLNTRLAKLDAPGSKFAGIILAQAGLVRMGWMNRISQILEPSDLLYAVGQGALAVECRSNDQEILKMLQALVCLPTTCRILAERSFLKTLGGGCSAPVAVCSTLNGCLNDDNCGAGMKVLGAVWSLDGTTEIRNELSCSLELERHKFDINANNDGSPPSKRARKDGSESPESKRASPTVINDDLNSGLLEKFTDIQQLINIHGELFKKCPFSAVHLKNREENGNSTESKPIKDECPLKIPVGQDFMGQCPYVGTDVKVNSAEICPITGNTPPAEPLDCVPSSSKCPFGGAKQTTTTLPGHDSCPFLQKTINMYDYGDEQKPQSTEVLPVLTDDTMNLFCGLFRHKCYDYELYAKSEKLGQALADDLISKGALDVMKCAQDEIHSKVS
ncbi:porphobilinogen deaminase [Eupeodes corollae]|uniref:porphobilinogen deaminase n=1 Tax=Eupeodes corollae TaxID=290404 RepID=UPI002493127C|nr:porphobilinogen deaminase [Eupeodes corollae]